MTSQKQYIEGLSNLTRTSKHSLDRIGVGLREAGYLPKGGRGLHSPTVDPETAATFLIALMASNKTSDAPKVVKVWPRLKLIRGDLNKAGLNTTPPPANFGEVTGMLFEDSIFNDQLEEIRVSRTKPKASIVYNINGQLETLEFGSGKEKPGERGGLNVEVVVHGEIIRELQNLVEPGGTAHTVYEITDNF